MNRRGEGGFGGLAEKLADLLVHVAQEVHVGRSPADALVLHQEVLEDELILVFLFHHRQLQTRSKSEEKGREEEEAAGAWLR